MSCVKQPARYVVALAMVALVAVLIANARFVYLAVRSQPDCVEHLKHKSNKPENFRAASPSC